MRDKYNYYSDRVLVTGGAGYIGSHVCKALRTAGFEPVCLDNFVSGHRQFVKWGPCLEVDLRDGPALRQLLAPFRFAAVIHLAGRIDVGASEREPLDFFSANVGGTIELLRALESAQGPTPVVFSSSAAVYGDPGLDLIPESTPLRPMNPYGTTKRMGEDLLRDLQTRGDWPHVILRYFNVAGADPEGEVGEWHVPETHLIPRLLEAHDHPEFVVKIYGDDYPTPDGTCVRDYVHVHDLAAAHVQAVRRLLDRRLTAACFNIGYSRGVSVRQMLAAVERVLGQAVLHQVVGRRAGDPARLVADARRAEVELGWQPQFAGDLDQTLRHAWNWQQRLRREARLP